jgi:hypothetical protein
VQHDLRKAVSAPMASKQRTAEKTVSTAEETRKRVHAPLDIANDAPAQRGPGRPPKGAARLEQVEQAVETARQESQRLAGQRAKVTQSMRAIGHAYHFVDLERGVRRNGKLIVRDIHEQIDTIRTIAHQEGSARRAWIGSRKPRVWYPQCKRPSSSSRGMCASRSVDWS